LLYSLLRSLTIPDLRVSIFFGVFGVGSGSVGGGSSVGSYFSSIGSGLDGSVGSFSLGSGLGSSFSLGSPLFREELLGKRLAPDLLVVCERDVEQAADHEDDGQELAGPDRGAGDVEGVGPQALDEEAEGAVTDEIDRGRLIRVLAVFAQVEQDAHQDDVAQRLVEKRWVNGHRAVQRRAVRCQVIPDLARRHAPRQRRCRSESLLVEEVAPSADRLPQRQQRRQVVQHRGVRDLPDPAHHPVTEEHRDDAAIDGKSAIPSVKDPRQILRIVVPLERHIVKARADDRARQRDKHQVIDQIRRELVLLRLLDCQKKAHQHRSRDDQAVPVHFEAADLERDRV